MKFKVIIYYDEFLSEFIKKHNTKYGTDFQILEFDYDEFTFATLETIQGGDDEIIELGISYGKSFIKYLIEGSICV